MTITEEIGTGGELTDLIRKVQAGAEILLTQNGKAVAKLVPVGDDTGISRAPLHIRSFKGHRVLTPVISQSDLAEDLFSRQ